MKQGLFDICLNVALRILFLSAAWKFGFEGKVFAAMVFGALALSISDMLPVRWPKDAEK